MTDLPGGQVTSPRLARLNESAQVVQGLFPESRIRRGDDQPIRAQAEGPAIPVADLPARALDHGHQREVVVRPQAGLDDQLAVTGCKQPVVVTVATKSAYGRAPTE